MKKLYITLLLVASIASLQGQNKDTQRADKLFNRFEYVEAAAAYLSLVEKGKQDPYVYKQLADSYYYTFNSAEAVKWYGKATETQQDAETYYRYAQMLKALGKYEEANKQMQSFAKLVPNDQRAKAFRDNPNYIPKLLEKDKLYEVSASAISSDKSDFGGILYGNDFYFTTARNGARRNYGWTEEPYLDLYKASYNTDGTITNPQEITSLNTKWHDGPITISSDGQTAYYSSESFNDKLYEKDKAANARKSRVHLYRASKVGDSWGNITALPFNSKEYSVGNPSLSRDGKTLYFASDMPGSIGGVDIWKVSISAEGNLGTPENLGSKVNTEGDESFPFIADDNQTLYFASSGRQGFGGYDLYKIELSNGEAQNLGKPVNSEKDDFSFSFNKDKNIGFFASNRNGNDDIYAATPICGVEVLTIVTDAKTGALLSNARVAIVDSKKNVIATETSNARGEVTYRVLCDQEYSLQVAKDGYESNTFSVAKSKGGKTTVNAALQPIDVIVTPTEIVLKPIFFEYDKSNITQEGAFELDKLVQVMKNNANLVILAKSHTDNRGTDTYNLSLSDRRAKATMQYIISRGISKDRISAKGMGETEPKVDCKETCTEEQHAQNRRSEFLIVKQ